MANWATVARLGDPSQSAWQRDNLVTIEPVPGQRWQVYREAAPAYQGFLSALAQQGYPIASSGGFNYRTIRGGDKLSQHAFGTAIDLNAATNPRVAPGAARVTDLPANVGELANRYGLEWGGNWSRPDAMHFEWRGDGSAAPTMAGVAPQQPVPSIDQLAPAAMAIDTGAGAMNPVGNLADMFRQTQEARQRQRDEEQAAADARRVALLSGGLAGLYGA